MTSGTPQKIPKEPNRTKPMLINMVKTVTTRNGMRKNTDRQGNRKTVATGNKLKQG